MEVRQLYRKDNMALIENLKGLAILFCASHVPKDSVLPGMNGVHVLGDLIGVTCVPLFCMLSAYFMRADIEKNTTAFIEKIGSMIIWTSAIGFVFAVVGNAFGIFDGKMPLVSTMGQFYLVLLILWKIITPYALRLHRWLLIAGLVCMFLGVFIFSETHTVPDLLKAFAFYTPFYFLGLMLHWKDIVALRDSPKKHYLLVVGVPVLIAVYCVMLQWNSFAGIWKEVTRFVDSVVLICLVFAYFPGYKIGFLQRVGSKCLVVYLFHFLLQKWLYGSWLYPDYIKTLSPMAITCATLSVYVGSLYLLSTDMLYRWFFKITNWTQNLIFRKASF